MTNTNNLPTLAAAAADALGTAHGRLAAAQFHGSLESITRAAAALDAALPAWTRALELAGLETRDEMAARAETRCEATMIAATRAYRRAA